MATKRVQDSQTFEGGLVDLAALSIASGYSGSPRAPLNSCYDILNWRLSVDGMLESRFGSRKLSTTLLNNVLGSRGYYWESQGIHVHVTAGGNFHYWTSETPPVVPTVLADPGILGAGLVTFAPFRDASGERLYYTSGQLCKFDGAALTNLGVAVVNNMLTVYNQRLFAGNGNAIVWSGLNNGDTLGDTLNGGGTAIITTTARANIKGLMPIGGSLFIMHENAISRFTGWSQDDIQIDTGTSGFSSTIGTNWPSSCVNLGHVGYFANSSGFYRLTEGTLEIISDQIDVSGFANATDVIGVYNKLKREIWWFPIQSTATNVYAYVFNLDLNAWTKFRYNEATITRAAWSSPTNVFITGQDQFIRLAESMSIVNDNANTDGTGGTRVVASFAKAYYFKDWSHTKALRFAELYGNFTALDTANTLFQVDPDALGSVTATLPTVSDPTHPVRRHAFRVGLSSVGRSFAVTVSAQSFANSATPVYLSSLSLVGFDYGNRF